MVQFMVPVPIRDELNRWAQVEDLNRTQLLRRLVMAQVKEHRQDRK